MRLELLSGEFSVCKLTGYIPAPQGIWFAAHTPNEDSLVCETRYAPAGAAAREDNWRALVVSGNLEFSLIGILSGITGALAQAGVSVFCVSTYDTDYVLVKSVALPKALNSLRNAGYDIQ